MTKILTALALVVFGTTALAQQIDTTAYERRLVPITVSDAQGAFETVWSTRLIGLNEMHNVPVYGLNYVNVVLPPVPNIPWLAAFMYTRQGDAPGSILYVPREHAAGVHLVANLRQSAGAFPDDLSLPVVKESEFEEEPLYFLHLHNSEAERTHLRVYSLDVAQSTVAVRLQIQAVHQQLGWQIRYDEVLQLRRNPEMTTGYQPVLPLRPWAIEVPLDELMQATGLSGPYVITVSPETAGAKIWAFVSETHNETQHIQLIMPQ